MTRLLFVRHGEAIHNLHPELIGGRSHAAPLTSKGINQAKQFGEYLRLAAIVPQAVYSSGALRATHTAQLALETAQLPLKIITDERFHELSQGDYEGADRIAVYTPDVVKQLTRDDIHGSLPGAESIHAAQMRMLQASLDISSKYPNGQVLVFSHGLAIRSLAGYFQNNTKPQILKMTTDNLSLSEIEISKRQEQVIAIGKNVINQLD